MSNVRPSCRKYKQITSQETQSCRAAAEPEDTAEDPTAQRTKQRKHDGVAGATHAGQQTEQRERPADPPPHPGPQGEKRLRKR